MRNAQLLGRTAQQVVLKKRQRLARDLHDSVTQFLYSLVLLADGGQRLAHAGRLDDMEAYLADLGSIALQSLKELRLLVYEFARTKLRPGNPPRQPAQTLACRRGARGCLVQPACRRRPGFFSPNRKQSGALPRKP